MLQKICLVIQNALKTLYTYASLFIVLNFFYLTLFHIAEFQLKKNSI